jgi:hypothetical protein
MGPWAKHPFIYEINTWVWLDDLSQTYGRVVSLASVPAVEWDNIAVLGMEAVWLMGVWERSPAGREVAAGNQDLRVEFRRALPDFAEEDSIGSAYCVRRYVVDARLGGPAELASAREQLAARGLRLILDFVPNHVARDHPWTLEHPEYFIAGTVDELQTNPELFAKLGAQVFACGRDPYFPAWADVLQLNAFHSGLRQAAGETLMGIADQCDGVRCDMAMLLMSPIFATTWGDRAGPRPATEYWVEAILAVRSRHPDFLFMAEAYWNQEWELQQQGFDYCYDKRLYDRLESDPAESLRLHLTADLAYQDHLVRFLENHDEPRAVATFSLDKGRAAAVIMATLPGAKLFHEGQLEGRRVRVPVFLRRRPAERADEVLQAFYRQLLQVATRQDLRDGDWRLCEIYGWLDNPSHLHLLAWCWRSLANRYLIVVNFSEWPAQGRILLPWDDLQGCTWRLHDLFPGVVYDRDGTEMYYPGLFVSLAPWDFHFFEFQGL